MLKCGGAQTLCRQEFVAYDFAPYFAQVTSKAEFFWWAYPRIHPPNDVKQVIDTAKSLKLKNTFDRA